MEFEGSLTYSQEPGMNRILSQMNPVHIFNPCLFNHLNIILIFKPWFSKLFLSFSVRLLVPCVTCPEKATYFLIPCILKHCKLIFDVQFVSDSYF